MVDLEVDYSSIDYNYSSICIIGNGDSLGIRLASKIAGEFPESRVRLLDTEDPHGQKLPANLEFTVYSDDDFPSPELVTSEHFNHIFMLRSAVAGQSGHKQFFNRLLETAEAMGALFIYADHRRRDRDTEEYYSALAENFLQYVDDHLTPAAGFIMPCIFSGTDTADRASEEILRAASAGEAGPSYSGRRDWLHIDDAARFLAVCGMGHSSGIFTMGSGVLRSYDDLLELFAGSESEDRYGIKDPASQEFLREFRLYPEHSIRDTCRSRT